MLKEALVAESEAQLNALHLMFGKFDRSDY